MTPPPGQLQLHTRSLGWAFCLRPPPPPGASGHLRRVMWGSWAWRPVSARRMVWLGPWSRCATALATGRGVLVHAEDTISLNQALPPQDIVVPHRKEEST